MSRIYVALTTRHPVLLPFPRICPFPFLLWKLLWDRNAVLFFFSSTAPKPFVSRAFRVIDPHFPINSTWSLSLSFEI